jgi:hypothetical protein
MRIHHLIILAFVVAIPLLNTGCDVDSDDDGWLDSEDCEPDNPDIHPDATETPGDGIDSNCDGADNPTAGDDDDDAADTDPGDFDSADAVTGDWSCKFQLPEPTAGATGEVVLTVEDFEEEDPVASAFVRVWADNDPTGAAADAWEGETDANGEVTIPAGEINACEPFATRVWTEFDPPETYQTFQIDVAVAGEAPYSEALNSVAYSTYQLLPLTVGVEPEPGKGIAAGRVYDCVEEPVANGEASVGTLDWDSGAVVEATGYAMRYFEDDSPEDDQLWISADGLFGGMNVPPGEWNLLLWGIPQDEAHCETTTGGDIIRTDRNDAYCLLGFTTLNVQPDSVNIANVDLKPFPDECYQ